MNKAPTAKMTMNNTKESFFVAWSNKKQPCSPEIAQGQALKAWVPEDLSAYHGQFPVCLTFDPAQFVQEEVEIVDAEDNIETTQGGPWVPQFPADERPVLNRSLVTPFRAAHWLEVNQFVKYEGGTSGTTVLWIPLEYGKPTWQKTENADFDPEDFSEGTHQFDKRFIFNFTADAQEVPLKETGISHYSLDLFAYDPGGAELFWFGDNYEGKDFSFVFRYGPFTSNIVTVKKWR